MANRAVRRQREKALAKARRLAQEAVDRFERHPGDHEAAVRASALTATVALMEQTMAEDP